MPETERLDRLARLDAGECRKHLSGYSENEIRIAFTGLKGRRPGTQAAAALDEERGAPLPRGEGRG